ncbi:MAG: adenine phosphoribosyltransferase [Armatimonadetes bacterium]|nr:adenine phosphoribosyltransferase [Armatimonadota bacterium]MDW8120764.1 adenine phosphoribosyltransferase [Armatimonadota bacterium]
MTAETAERLKLAIRSIPDFPKPGVLFRDITPVLQSPELFRQVIDAFTDIYEGRKINVVAAIESRGFIFAAPVSLRLNAGFVPLRKSGKLPYMTYKVHYSLEYALEAMEMHVDALKPGQRVLLMDDLLATGGTAQAACRLIQQAGGIVESIAFFIELSDLKGREKLHGYEVISLVQFP